MDVRQGAIGPGCLHRVVVIKSDYRARPITFANSDEGYPVGSPAHGNPLRSIRVGKHLRTRVTFMSTGEWLPGLRLTRPRVTGSVDDSSSSQTQIIGMVFTTARSNTGNVNAMWSYPFTL